MRAWERLEHEGHAHLEARRIDEALRCYDRALRLGATPLAAVEKRWSALMQLGHFERAWQETDRTERLRRIQPPYLNEQLPRHLRRVWDGQPLDGRRVRILCYHGLGDTLQFARYLPLVAGIARSVTVECQPELGDLLRLSFPAIPFDRAGESRDKEQDKVQLEDVRVELMELAYAFRTTLETIPRCVPYLYVPGRLREQHRNQLSSAGVADRALKVGVVWTSGPWNEARNIAIEQFQLVLQNPAARFVSLEPGRTEAGFHALLHRPDLSGTVLSTAATIDCLDLVISVDTMVAHLAAALGKPVWTLLPFQSDWRWMSKREDSPWYPTMRLIRQERAGDWSSALQQVRLRLRRMTASEHFDERRAA